jgi:hypothetical protein
MAKTKFIGFVYESTNIVTGKKYIGSHIGKDTDVYFGSGIDLLDDIKRFGIGCFIREILDYSETIEDLKSLEQKWLRQVDAKNNINYYNRSNLSSGVAKKHKDTDQRPLCTFCHVKPAAINCYKNGQIYYRSRCNGCLSLHKRKKSIMPRWQKAGYKKKPACDRCGFKARHPTQLTVFHVDGNLNNCEGRNLKTTCLNCIAEIVRLELPWRRGDLEPDH